MTVRILTADQADQARADAAREFGQRLADAEAAAWGRVDDAELHARLQASLYDRARQLMPAWYQQLPSCDCGATAPLLANSGRPVCIGCYRQQEAA